MEIRIGGIRIEIGIGEMGIWIGIGIGVSLKTTEKYSYERTERDWAQKYKSTV